MRHDLKTWPEQYRDVVLRRKKFEIRFNDRGYKVGDTLRLYEFDPVSKSYSGSNTTVTVTYILANESFGLQRGFIIMGIHF